MSSTLTLPPASRISRLLTAAILALLVGAALLLGPIEQPADYHDFADRHALWGIPHAQDLLSNLPFALVALGDGGGWQSAGAPGVAPPRGPATVCFSSACS